MATVKSVLKGTFGRRWLQYYAAFTCTIAMFISGMDYVWPSPTLPKLYSKISPIHISSNEGSWLASFSPMGDFFGAPMAAFTADYFGRRNAICLAVVPYLIAWIVIYFAESLPYLLFARFLVGFADGQHLTIIPMYLGEMAECDIRGRLGNLMTVMADLGTLFMYCVGPYVSISTMALIGGIFPLITLATFLPMPESPYYYLTKQDYLNASRSLKELRGKSNIDHELVELHQVVTLEMAQPNTWSELFTNKSNRKALYLMIGLKFAQQLSGISAFLVYSEIIFTQAAGCISPAVSAIIFGLVQLASSSFSAVAVDYWGRKPLLISSCIGSAIPLVGQGIYFYLQQKTNYDISQLSWVPITTMLIFIVMYCYGLGAIVFMIPGEMFPTNIKAKALCLLDLVFALSAFTVVKLYQVVADTFGEHVPFFAFAIFCILSMLFIIFYLPETKGRTLDEIQLILKGLNEDSYKSETKPLLNGFNTYPKISSDNREFLVSRHN